MILCSFASPWTSYGVSWCMKLSEEQKIECMGVCVGCAGTIKHDGEAFPAHVFLGHLCRWEWRELREVRSERPGCHFLREGKKDVINELWFVAGQKKAYQRHSAILPEAGRRRRRRIRRQTLIFLSAVFEAPPHRWSCFSWSWSLESADRKDLCPLHSGQGKLFFCKFV